MNSMLEHISFYIIIGTKHRDSKIKPSDSTIQIKPISVSKTIFCSNWDGKQEKPCFGSIQNILVVSMQNKEDSYSKTFQVIKVRVFHTMEAYRGLWRVEPTQEDILIGLHQVEEIQCILVPTRELFDRQWNPDINDSLIIRFNRVPMTYAPQ